MLFRELINFSYIYIAVVVVKAIVACWIVLNMLVLKVCDITKVSAALPHLIGVQAVIIGILNTENTHAEADRFLRLQNRIHYKFILVFLFYRGLI